MAEPTFNIKELLVLASTATDLTELETGLGYALSIVEARKSKGTPAGRGKQQRGSSTPISISRQEIEPSSIEQADGEPAPSAVNA